MPVLPFKHLRSRAELSEGIDTFSRSGMASPLNQTARTVSVIAGTLVALSCGTNVSLDELLALTEVIVNGVTVCIFSMGATICSPDEALIDREQLDRKSSFAMEEELRG